MWLKLIQTEPNQSCAVSVLEKEKLKLLVCLVVGTEKPNRWNQVHSFKSRYVITDAILPKKKVHRRKIPIKQLLTCHLNSLSTPLNKRNGN